MKPSPLLLSRLAVLLGAATIPLSAQAQPGVSLELVGTYSTSGTAWDVKVLNGFAYVADEYSLQVLDVRDPSKPALAGSLEIQFAAACSVDALGSHAFVGRSGSELHVLDVSDPSRPAKVAGSTENVDRGCGVGDYVFATRTGHKPNFLVFRVTMPLEIEAPAFASDRLSLS